MTGWLVRLCTMGREETGAAVALEMLQLELDFETALEAESISSIAFNDHCALILHPSSFRVSPFPLTIHS